jgi:hypothetical protein
MSELRVGIDFDNTLIDYDRVFLAAARERGLVAADFAGAKRAVRDAIRRLPNGELAWQRLQGHVYGAGITGAVPYAGAAAFLRRCADAGAAVFVVSHKTRYGHHDPARVNLRAAARDWMAAHGFFRTDRAAIPPDHVFFEDDRGRKLARIAALRCTHFIDDLEEVFADSRFPEGVCRILLAGTAAAYADAVCADAVCADWQAVATAVFDDTG